MITISSDDPVLMEEHFSPGFITKPAVHLGSQSMRLYHGDEQEQAIEAVHLAASSPGDVVILRNVDEDYIRYWRRLIGDVQIINIKTDNKTDFLSHLILSDDEISERIKASMHPESTLMVYFPTDLEDQISKKLGIRLHGNKKTSDLYGTKTGIRTLADEAKICMPEGYICSDPSSVKSAVETLFRTYEKIIVKHDLSSAGRWMCTLQRGENFSLNSLLDELCGGKFNRGKDAFVVEGWVKNKASLCAHIEILENRDPVLAAAWQQIIDTDGITYMGAGPLHLSKRALDSFKTAIRKLANALKDKGAYGSFGPDFLIASEDDPNFEEDTALLIELNARVPFTAFPLEIIKQVRGKIGNSFYVNNFKLKKRMNFHEIESILSKKNLLIKTKNFTHPGIIPYNIGQLQWNTLYFVALADNYKEARATAVTVELLLGK